MGRRDGSDAALIPRRFRAIPAPLLSLKPHPIREMAAV